MYFYNKLINYKYDNLTSLYERNFFYDETSKMLNKWPDEVFVVVSIDILNFRIINEFYSNIQGDLFLKFIAKCIKTFFEDDKKVTYSREHADVFIICFKYEEKRLKDFISYMKDKINNYKLGLFIRPYFGINIIDEENRKSKNIPFICEASKLALKSIKGSYITYYAYFNENLRNQFMKKILITNDMNKALANKEFEIYLQPKCNLLTNACFGAEALVRWNHPEKGLISPQDFIPIFEENGFIMKLDEYMCEQVCILLKKWIDEDKKVVPISVNISVVNLRNAKLYDTLVGFIEKYQIPVRLLELEITETVYTKNQDSLLKLVEKLQTYGFKILMDDFGSGYSSLSTLNKLPVDILKMDLKFLDNKKSIRNGNDIVSMVVKMANNLGIKVIAEGIENIEHIKFLKSVGCIMGQGYYFSKPIPVKEFEESFFKYITNNENSLDEKSLCEINENSFSIKDYILKNSELFFHETLYPTGIIEYKDGNCIPITMNNQFFKFIKISKKIFFSRVKNIFDFIYKNDYLKVKNDINNAIKNNKFTQGSCRILNQDENILWIKYKIRYVSCENDSYILYITFIDITDIKYLKSKLKSERIKNELISNKFNCVSFEYDIKRDRCYLKSSIKGEQLINNMINYIKSLYVLEHNDKLKIISIIQHSKNDFIEGNIPFKLKNLNGQYKTYSLSYSKIRDESGEFNKIVGIYQREYELGDLKYQESMELLKSMFALSPLGIVLVRRQENFPIISANNFFYKLIGYTKEQIKSKFNNSINDIVDDSTIKKMENFYLDIKSFKNEQDVFYKTVKINTSNNQEKYFLCAFNLINAKDEGIINIIMSDITEMELKFNDLNVKNESLIKALLECNICVWEYDIVNKKIIQTKTSKKIYGEEDVIENVPNSLIKLGKIHKDSIKDFKNMYKLLEDGKKQISSIIKIKQKDGSYWWQKIIYTTIYNSEGKAIRALGIADNITKIVANKTDKKEELYTIAYMDELTSIGNRRAGINYINELLKNKCVFCVSYIDIDDLKKVNDKLGHNKGDEYIKSVVNAIRGEIRSSDAIFRIGGDEFILIMPECTKNIIDKKMEHFNNKIENLNLGYDTSISYGNVQINSNTNMTCKQILYKADAKMYKKKKIKKKIQCAEN